MIQKLTELGLTPLSIGVALAIITVTLFIQYYKNDAFGANVRIASSVPRPSDHLPVTGLLLTTLKHLDDIHDYWAKMMGTPNFKTTLYAIPFCAPMLISNNPKVLEHVLKTNFENYVKGEFASSRIIDLFGHGIFNSDGEPWKRQRKLAAHIFNTRIFKHLFETVFANEMTSFLNILDEKCKSKATFDVQDLFLRFTLTSFATIGFGVELDCLKGKAPPFAAAFDRSQLVIVYRFFSPFWTIEESLAAQKRAQFKADLKTIREFGSNIVAQRRQESAEKLASRHDLLSLFMASKDESGRDLTDNELIDHIINFIIAGRDTTAQVLSWSVYCLAKNPRVADLLNKEIKESLGSALTPTYDQTREMKYANAVFHETLRLYPSAPSNTKTAVADDVLPDGTPIPKGAQFGWNFYAAARDTKLWGPDAAEFRPERWLEMKSLPSQFEYPVFNCGPRICLGRNLAELEGVFVLVSILRQYSFSVMNVDKVTYSLSVTLPIKNGLTCTVSKRD